MREFANKTAVITGGTSGIGLAITQALTAAGAHAIPVGLPDFDLTSQNHIDRLLDPIESLDILINCAGMLSRDEEFQIETFERVIDVNLTGTMRMCIACKPLLSKSRGCIVNTSSMLAFFGGPRVPAYSASKGAISQLTRSLAIAWAPDGIRVNAVAPGWIATPLTEALQNDPGRAAPILARTPMARWGQPEDIAGPVLFLCSKAAAFITGVILPVDGGYSAA